MGRSFDSFSTRRRADRWRHVWAALLAAVLLYASLSTLSLTTHAAPLRSGVAIVSAAPPTLAYTLAPCVAVHTAPDQSAPLITQLLGGADVTLLGTANPGWSHVRIWSHTEGYVTSVGLSATPPANDSAGDCTFPGVPDPQPGAVAAPKDPQPLQATAQTTAPTTLFAWPDTHAAPLAGLSTGVPLTISQWASDGAGKPWYHVSTPQGSGWLWSGDARLDEPDPATYSVHGKPVWAGAAGKGMWFTNYLTRHADLTKLMADAKAAGMTHIYAEVAISKWGFYGANSLDRLLPAAHAQGITVIAWVYPTLANISSDIEMTRQVVNYRTPSGDHADGLSTDVEENIDPTSVYSYGQVVRGLVGPGMLMEDAALHPFTHAEYPYAAIASTWNVISPMNYWHSRYHHLYTAQDVTKFVTSSVVTIRAAMQAGGVAHPIPIEELGQMYDMYSDDSAGVGHNPSGAEITADIDAARSLGCIGVSYFEWQTATQSQWDAFSAYAWPQS